MEASLHQVEVELESVRVQLEEEAEARLDMERQLVKASSDCITWKSKYDSEAAARAEEVEEIRLVNNNNLIRKLFLFKWLKICLFNSLDLINR